MATSSRFRIDAGFHGLLNKRPRSSQMASYLVMFLGSFCQVCGQSSDTSTLPVLDPPAAQKDGDHFFGDWGGYRTTLTDRGIYPNVFLISDPFGNLTGGQRTGFTDYSLLGVDVRFNTQRIFNWNGGQFRVGAAVNFGTSLSAHYVGNTFPIQLADVAGVQPRLTYLSYSQDFSEGKVNVLVGRLTVNSVESEEFMGSEYFKAFASVGFNLVPQGLFLTAPGASGYPHTAWGLRMRYAPSRRLYVQAGAYNGDPKAHDGSQHGVDFSARGPLFAIGELGLRWNSAPSDTGLARNLKIGGYYNAGEFAKFVGSSQTVHGNYGLYILGDQAVWRFAGPADRHLGVFAAFTATPLERLNTVPYFFDAGMVVYGPLQNRSRDSLALGVVYGAFKNGPQQAPASIRYPSNQQTIELNYGFALARGLLVQPSLQYIVHPKGISSETVPLRRPLSNALTIGINIVATL